MTPERFRQIEQLAEKALDLPAQERASFLDEACGEDLELRRGIEDLLQSYNQVETFLEEPVAPRMPTLDIDGRSARPDTEDIGPYRLERRIGRGGMGDVYLASRADGTFKRRVALKRLHYDIDSEEAEQRFQAERQILATLDHPNIARLLDGGTDTQGRPYLVMEYIEGRRIDQYCDANRLSVDERLRLFIQICSAVQSAHQSLVVHRDLKPANILVTEDGVPKLLDFGIAKLLDPNLLPNPVEATRTDAQPMTPRYASPEQILALGITTATDVYTLGVLLYELLTGRLPTPDSTSPIHMIEWASRDEEPTRPSVLVSGAVIDDPAKAVDVEAVSRDRSTRPAKLRDRLEGDLDTIVLQALRRDPLERYASAEQFAEDIQRHLEGLPVRARTPTFQYRMGKFLKRNRWPVGIVALITCVVFAFIVIVAFQAHNLTLERDRVALERDKARKVSDFMVDLFEIADPSETRGNTVTVREILDRGAIRIREQLDDQPEIQLRLMHTIGRVYSGLGLFDQSEALLEEAWTSEHLGVDATNTLGILLDLAAVHTEQGHPDEALELLRLATEQPDGSSGELASTPPERALLLAHESVNLMYLDRYDEGIQRLSEVEVLLEDIDETSPFLVSILARAGTAELTLGRFDHAVDLLERSLEIHRARPQGSPVETSPLLLELSHALRHAGDLQRAEEVLKRGLDLVNTYSRAGHPDQITFRETLAKVHLERGRMAEAVALGEECLARAEPQHQASRQARFRFGRCLHVLGRAHSALDGEEQGVPFLEQSLAITTELLAEKPLEPYRELHASNLIRLGRIDEATPLALELLRGPWKSHDFVETCASVGIAGRDGVGPTRKGR